MQRESSLTFEGALGILGHYEPKWIEKLDNVLGGVILGAGAAAGIAAVGPAALAPLGMFAAVWGWLEQKDQALGLLRKVIRRTSERVAGTKGYERRQLIGAAHTTIVVAAFFEVLNEHLSDEEFSRFQISDEEKIRLIAGLRELHGVTVYDRLYTVEIPSPSAACGFEENVRLVEPWFTQITDLIDDFISGLSTAQTRWINRLEWSAIAHGAAERYRSHFLMLAATVPEFMIWAMLGEHAATRSAVGELRADIAAVLDGRRDALSRVEALLALDVTGGGAAQTGPMPVWAAPAGTTSDLRKRVAMANRAVLTKRIISEDMRTYGPDIDFPTVDDSYVNPRYRVTSIERLGGRSARPSDEGWWNGFPSRDDFDLLLAAYVTSPNATRVPMLLLGHPGAGKSMLAKVFAARLPPTAYTVVRVPLRQVEANARVIKQIEEALYHRTHRHMEWWELAEQSQDTVLVVLLDGLDELLQASEHDRSSYLQDVMEFQEREAEQQRPVIVVVTSRTVVADRVRIPYGTTIVKLDPFSDDDIADWLGRWRRANAASIAAGKMGELTLSAALSQHELATQPLLLTMLAIYAADLAMPPLDAELGTSELYRRLLDEFARREAAKELDLGHDPHPDELEQRVRDHLARLEIAALAMFNRGRQDIGEEPLGKDLEALDPRLMERSRPAEAGQRIIGEFFFVHAPEARMLTGAGERTAGPGRQPAAFEQSRRSYEFLHATFGEYLVARRVIDELVEAAEKACAGRRGPTEPDDDLLYALLSHQALAARKTMLDFAEEIFTGLSDMERPRVLEVLEVLIRTYRNRHGSDKYTTYRPVPPDQVRQLAYYSANLVALRVVLKPTSEGVPLEKLVRVPDNAMDEWHTTPDLWRASLDVDALQAMLTTIELIGMPPRLRANTERNLALIPFEISLARLIGDQATETRLRYGTAIVDEVAYYSEGDSWRDVMASWLIPMIAGRSAGPTFFKPSPAGTPDNEVAYVARLIFEYLKSSQAGDAMDTALLKLLFELPRVFAMDELALAMAVLSNPDLRREIPELKDTAIYGSYADIVRRSNSTRVIQARGRVNFRGLSDETIATIKMMTQQRHSILRV